MSFNISDIEKYFHDRMRDAFGQSIFPEWSMQEYRRALPEGGSDGTAVSEVGSGLGALRPRRFYMDLSEKPDGYVIDAELPGMDKENIQIYTEGNNLIICAEKSEEKRDDQDRRHIYERSYGKFQRTLRMPDNCSMEDPKVSYENGVLHLDFKKVEPTNRKMIKL